VLLAELGSLLGRDVQPEDDRLIHAGGANSGDAENRSIWGDR
jgi:hypothetical protein